MLIARIKLHLIQQYCCPTNVHLSPDVVLFAGIIGAEPQISRFGAYGL